MLAFFSKTISIYIAIGAIMLIAAVYWYFAPRDTDEVITVSRGEFIQEVSASGKVQSADAVDLGFSQGGRIAKVNVRVGDTVNTGNLLANIENGEARATLSQKEAALAVREAELLELKEGTRPEEVAVAEAEVANKKAAFVQAHQSLIEAIQESYVVAQDALYNHIDQFVLNPRSASPQMLVSLENSGPFTDFTDARVEIETLFSTWKPLVGSMTATVDLTRSLMTARGNLAELSNLLTIAATALSRAIPTTAYPTASILEYAADVATGRANVQSALSALTSAETSYRAAETALATAESNLALKKAGATPTGITAQMAQVRAAEADVAAATALLEKTEIRAPFDGTVTAVDAKVGQIVTASDSVISMIGIDAFEIESYVPEINIALLSVGDSARITLDAYGEGVSFLAHVSSIDPAETLRDGVSTYRVTLAFDVMDERIRSGMTANVVITTDHRSDVISIPQGLVRAERNGNFVIVSKNGAQEKRIVTTGAISSFGNVEILSGLQEGDVLPITD